MVDRPAGRGSSEVMARVVMGLGVLMWAVVGFRVVVEVVSGGVLLAPSPQPLVLGVLGAFFLVAVARCVVSAVGAARPVPPLLLAGALLLWVSGSVSIGAGVDLHATSFPAPGEALFLSAYVLLAAALILGGTPATPATPVTPDGLGGPGSGPGRPRSDDAIAGVPLSTPLGVLLGASWRRGGGVLGGSASGWLDAVVVCSGAFSLAGVVLLSPLGQGLEAEGVGLLLALLYPLLDVILAVLVLGQVMLRQRSLTRHTLGIWAGLGCLAAADSTFVLSLDSLVYVSNVVVDTLYGVGFALLVGGVCAAGRAGGREGGRAGADGMASSGPRARAVVLLGAGAVALTVLAVPPGDVGHWYLSVPSVLTLLAIGARLMLALREAQGAVEARRLSLTDELTGCPTGGP